MPQHHLKEFATLVTDAAGVPPPRWRLPLSLAMVAATVSEGIGWLMRREPLLPRDAIHANRFHQQLDGSKALRELLLPQTPIEEAIRRALAWFTQHGYLS